MDEMGVDDFTEQQEDKQKATEKNDTVIQLDVDESEVESEDGEEGEEGEEEEEEKGEEEQ